MKIPLAYKSGGVVGCDIGGQTVKVVQLGGKLKSPKALGYGLAQFDPKWVAKGVIVDPQKLAGVIKTLLTQPRQGQFKARAVGIAVPMSVVYVRPLQLPALKKEDIAQAVQLEVEQYIPVPSKDLYVDYEIVNTLPDKTLELQIAAVPRVVVDSHMKLFELLGLLPESVEVSIAAIMRSLTQNNTTPTLLADFGSAATDIVVGDRTIKLSSTLAVGGNTITQALVKSMNVTVQQADEIKQKFGIGPSGLRKEILAAIEPHVQDIVKEINKAIKYYNQRGGGQQIQRIVMSGGSSYMPGLKDYLTKLFQVPVVINNPWQNVNFGNLAAPGETEQATYTTAVGLALVGMK